MRHPNSIEACGIRVFASTGPPLGVSLTEIVKIWLIADC